MLDDGFPTDPERSMMDKERKDLLSKDDMLKLFQYLLDDQLPKSFKKEQELFFCTAGRGIGSSFLRDTDEFIMLNRFDFSNILYRMSKPRSEKTVYDYIIPNEMRMNLLANIRKSQGTNQRNTNLLSLFSTIVKHNVHTMTDSGSSGGFMGRAKAFFKGV